MSRELQVMLDHPNVRRYLDLIAQAEGTAQHTDPYRVAFGGGRIADLSGHPGTVHRFTQTDGRLNQTTAAGKYQFLARTWRDLARELGLQDFSARSQDLGALALMRRSGSLADVLRGDYASAIRKDGRIWASLPSSPYAQPKRSEAFIAATLGRTAAPTHNVGSTTPTPTHAPIPLPPWLPIAPTDPAAPPSRALPTYTPQALPALPAPDVVPYAIDDDLRQLRRSH